MHRISYGWAVAAAGCLTAAAELVAPVVPGLTLIALLTILIAQVPVPAPRPEQPRTERPPRSELERHIDRRIRQ
jgi:hypothetical protein